MTKLYIFCGIPFAGKTNLAKKIADRFGFTRIDLDEIKFEIFGNDIEDESIDQNGWDKIYQEMYAQIRGALITGKTVIHDTGNFTVSERNIVRKIGEDLGIETVTVFVDTPQEIAKQRLHENRRQKNRFDITDAAFESAAAEMEPPQANEKHIVFDTNTDEKIWISQNFS